MKGSLSPAYQMGWGEEKDLNNLRTLPSDHIRNLDNGVNLCLWEDTFSAGTLDIKAQDPQGSYFGPVTFRCV